MKHHFWLAGIGFTIGFIMSSWFPILLLLDIGLSRWELIEAMIFISYYSFSGAFIFVSLDVLLKTVVGQKQMRLYSACLLGALVGLSFLGGMAFLHPDGLERIPLHLEQGLVWAQRSLLFHDLVAKATLLASCTFVLEECFKYAGISAVLTAAAVLMGEKVRSRSA